MASELTTSLLVDDIESRGKIETVDSFPSKRRTSLYAQVCLLLFQFLSLGDIFYRETIGPLVLCNLLLGLLTILYMYAFNQLCKVSNHNGSESNKKVWALKHLWEIKTNMVLQTILTLIEVYLAIDFGYIRISRWGEYDNTKFTIFDFCIQMFLMAFMVCLYITCIDYQDILKLESDEESKTSHLLFSEFQVSFKVACVGPFVLQSFMLLTNLMHTLGFLALVGISFFLFPKIVTYLFSTPSSLVFHSSEIQTQIIDKAPLLYTGMGISFFLHHLFWAYQFVSLYNIVDVGPGFIFMRISHIILYYLMYLMASENKRFKVGVRYVVADALFSMFNLLAVLCSILFISPHLYYNALNVVLTCGIVFVCIKLERYAKLFFDSRNNDEIVEDYSSDLHYLTYYFIGVLFGIWVHLVSTNSLTYTYHGYELKPYTALGPAMCWLISFAMLTFKLTMNLRF